MMASAVRGGYDYNQSHFYRSRAERHFYGTKNVMWASFGSIGNTEKKSLGRLDSFFHVFGCKFEKKINNKKDFPQTRFMNSKDNK